MKKTMLVLLALMIALAPLFAIAEAPESPVNQNIQKVDPTEIPDVVPEDETKEVVPPKADIVPDTEPVTELQDELKTIYRLTIRYIYLDGTPAAETYDAILQVGTDYSVTSPVIERYTTADPIVTGTMPNRDVIRTVVYLAEAAENEEETPIFKVVNVINMEDYETPLGLGFSMINVGRCFE